MHDSKVICDLCERVQPLEPFNGNSNYRMPAGWATIAAHITIAGVNRAVRDSIKERVRKRLVPTFHLCPDCTRDKEKDAREKAEADLEAKKIQRMLEPARRQIQLGE